MTTSRVPKPSLHNATGQAVVCLNMQDHYLGSNGSVEAKARYEKLISQRLAHGRTFLSGAAPGLAVNELLLAYFTFINGHYRARTDIACVRDALRIVRQCVGHTPAASLPESHIMLPETFHIFVSFL